MTIQNIINSYFWLFTQWWFWVVFIVGAITYWFLFRQRTYKTKENKLFIRHGKLGKWLDLDEHLQKEHPLEWELLQRETKDKDKWTIYPSH